MNAPLAPATRRPPPALSRAARAALVRELATLTAVMPISDAVDVLARQPRPAREAAVLAATDRALKAGRSLAAALPASSFPADLRATVAAGEASGRLPQVLGRLADGLEADLQLRSRLLASLAYPALLVVVALVVVLAMLLFVVPGIARQYEGTGVDLPWLTRAVLAVSGFVARWGWLLGLLVVAGLAAFLALRRREAGRHRFDALLLALPLVGRFVAWGEAVRYARLMAVMLGAGLPVAEALQLVAPALATRPWTEGVRRMTADVRAGRSLAAASAALPRAPALLLSLTRTGEASGRLGPLLDGAAAALDRQLADRTRALMSLVEPAIIVALGLVVGGIILAVLLPILRLNALAGQSLGLGG
ncbi:MAG: type II secretion system F family protein [Sphingomonadaceae bacterium]|uniref:type II secretion system F family protein n=1 Tax=Thermaurantiacus sp. TaxID=2820283 RepID=UPI00298ED458|nr:type II secretion system F family protein [Thermaurantiacus sp.]MCS6987417.1 type II secretion system F family protein [Sphingomonadaceae bacterium]MDW8415337.1 type II secretion system F family protein [Thermaurantiacus sp.]